MHCALAIKNQIATRYGNNATCIAGRKCIVTILERKGMLIPNKEMSKSLNFVYDGSIDCMKKLFSVRFKKLLFSLFVINIIILLNEWKYEDLLYSHYNLQSEVNANLLSCFLNPKYFIISKLVYMCMGKKIERVFCTSFH